MIYRPRLWVLGLYVGTSYYFLQHPEKLHFKKDNILTQMSKDSKLVFAHRGGSTESPENTM